MEFCLFLDLVIFLEPVVLLDLVIFCIFRFMNPSFFSGSRFFLLSPTRSLMS